MIDTIKISAPISKRLMEVVRSEMRKKSGGDKLSTNHRYLYARVFTTFGNFKVTINAEEKTMEMELSPMKMLKGHNVFGTNHFDVLMLGVIEVIYHHFKLPFTDGTRLFYKRRGCRVCRMDVTASFLVESQNNVVDTLGMIRKHLLAHGHNIVTHEGPEGVETVYVGKSSKNSTAKFYNKHLEILARNNSAAKALPYYQELLSYAEKVVRFEVTLRSPALKYYGLEDSEVWSVSKVRELLEERLVKLGFSGQLLAELPEEVVAGLGSDKRRKYQMWLDGIELRKYHAEWTFERDQVFFRRHRLDIVRPRIQAQNSVVLSSRLSVKQMKMTYPKRFVPLGAVKLE